MPVELLEHRGGGEEEVGGGERDGGGGERRKGGRRRERIIIMRRRSRKRRRERGGEDRGVGGGGNTVTSQETVMFRVTAVRTIFTCTTLNFLSFNRNSIGLCSRILLSPFPFSIFFSPVHPIYSIFSSAAGTVFITINFSKEPCNLIYSIFCRLIPTHSKYICILALNSLKMAT